MLLVEEMFWRSSCTTTAKENKEDVCSEQLQKYLDCVKTHERGLSEGNECSTEVANYKACRKSNKSRISKSD